VYEFESTVWRWRDDGAWHFLTLPDDVSDDIDDRTALKAGFGSVKVEVTIGSSTWRTSIFPSKEARAFILPVKKAVRVAEGCEDGSRVRVRLSVET